MTVADNGRGIPVDKHPRTKKPALEMVLHDSARRRQVRWKELQDLWWITRRRRFGRQRAVEEACGGCETRRCAAPHGVRSKGKTIGKLQKAKAKIRGTGTTITFTPDPTIFPKTEFDPGTIRKRLEVTSFLHKGVKVTFSDESNGNRDTFLHEQGIVDYLGKVLTERSASPIHETPFTLSKENGERIELAMQWTESTDEHVRSYVNGIPTLSGGSHENGFRAGLTKAIRNYVETHNLVPRGVKITHEDIREGLVAIVSVFIADPQFQGQTKDRLNNPELQAIVDGSIRPGLEQWLNSNRTIAESIVARIIAAARARAASRAASAAVSRKSATSKTMLPGKLSDCLASGRANSELFIVEGDSAGGSAKQARDRNYQAILPLRGKVLNTESASLKKVMDNKELQDMVTALGCGIGKSFEISRLRYERIILLADADSDGHHITTLMLTFFYRHLPLLISEGKVHIGMPPLFRIDIGKERHWATDEADRERILASADGRSSPELTRFKGLGEMPPKDLWETTLNPKTRRLLRVEVDDQLETDRVISDLMGRDASARFRFIMDRAPDAEGIDV